jgi:hypothetical protein
MKTFIILFLLLSISLTAQSLWWVDTTATGEEKTVYLGNFDSEIISGGMRFRGLPVRILGGSTIEFAIDTVVINTESMSLLLAAIEVLLDTSANRQERIHDELIKKMSQETGDSIFSNIVKTNELLLTSANSYSEWLSTKGTTVDTVTFGFNTRIITAVNDGTSSDTLYISSDASFPSKNTIKRVGGEAFTKLWREDILYLKVGYIPIASKKIRIEAN